MTDCLNIYEYSIEVDSALENILGVLRKYKKGLLEDLTNKVIQLNNKQIISKKILIEQLEAIISDLEVPS